MTLSSQHLSTAPPDYLSERPKPPPFAILENDLGDGLGLVQVVGELDAAVVERLVAAIAGLPTSLRTIALALDECEFIDSSGIAAILRSRRELDQASRRLVLCAPRGQVRRVLELTGVLAPGFVIETLDDLPETSG